MTVLDKRYIILYKDVDKKLLNSMKSSEELVICTTKK
ncbi:UNVERIFIED_CONTAM: hypothetical protein Cloal_0077 [Acetivibrio alkalicellulosi]